MGIILMVMVMMNDTNIADNSKRKKFFVIT